MTEMNAISMPENGGERILTEEPTVLVCAGEGGIEMGKEVRRLAAREGVADRVKTIAINTGSGKFAGLDPEVAKINLKTPDRRFHGHDKEVRHYLDAGVTIEGGRGSDRDRPVGRYHFDNPEYVTDKIESTLRTTITEFVKRFENDPDVNGVDAVNVFQLVGAGGGTGSGITPLLTGCLDGLLDELNDEVHPGFEQWLITSLASEARSDSDVKWHYVGNSLALLDELRALTGYDGDVSYPIRIPVYSASDGANDVPSAYVVDDNPFSGVFLLRYDQDKANDDEYRAGATRTAARTVLEWMRKGERGVPDIENEVNDLDHTFYEVRGATFETPAQYVEELLEANEELEAARERETERTGEQADLRAAIEAIKVVLDARSVVTATELVSPDTDAGEDQRCAPSHVRSAFDRAQQIAGNISPSNVRMEDVEAKRRDYSERLGQAFHDRIDDETVEEAVFMAAMLKQTESALVDHRFNAVVTEFVTANEDRITEFDPAFDPGADPKDQYLQTIKPLLNDRIDDFTAEVDSFGLTDRISDRESYKRATRKLENTKKTLQTMQGALSERDRLAQLIEDLESSLGDALADLEAEYERLESRHAEAASEHTRASQEREAAADTVDRVLRKLQEGPLGRFVSIPVAGGTELTADLFEDKSAGEGRAPGIAKLIDSGVVDRGDVVDRIRQTLRDHEETVIGPTLETRGAKRTHIRGSVRVFCTEGLEELVWAESPSGTAPSSLADNEFPGGSSVVRSEDPHRIGLLAVYGGLDLDNFDHGALRESLSRGRPEWNGEAVPLEDCYAYPELLPPEHPMSMQSQIEQVDVESWGDLDD
jgi:hypothetical protein